MMSRFPVGGASTTGGEEATRMTSATRHRGRPPELGRQVRVGSVTLDALSRDEVVDAVVEGLAGGRGGLIITPNVSIARELRRPGNAVISRSAALSVCDGMPLLWASHLAGTPLPGRVTGSSLIRSLSRAAASAGRSVYVLGGPPGAAQEAARRLGEEVDGLVVSGWTCPPMGFERDAATLASLVEEVVGTRPDIVFVGLGFPKQEHLALALAGALPRTWFVGCGAAVEFVAGRRRRAPRWMQDRGLEWLHRLSQEPRRLAPRYARDALYASTMLARAALGGVRGRRQRSTAAR